MIVGVGLDLANVQFWADVLTDPTTSVIEGSFTSQEQEDCLAGPVPASERYAARFAAKEAAIKALAGHRVGREPLFEKISFLDIEVLRDAWGRPSLKLSGAAHEIATAIGVGQIHVSMTHEEAFSAAVVILETKNTSP